MSMCPHARRRGPMGLETAFFATTRLFEPVAGRKSACGASNSTGGIIIPNYPNRIRQIGYFAFFSAVIQGFGVKKRFHPLNFNGFHSNLLVRNDLRHFRPFHLGNPG